MARLSLYIHDWLSCGEADGMAVSLKLEQKKMPSHRLPSLKPLDVFDKISRHFPAVFVASNEQMIFSLPWQSGSGP